MSADADAPDAEPEDADAEESAADARPLVGQHHEEVDLAVFPPAIPRGEVESAGRVGAVAYPYRVYDAEVELDRPFLSPRKKRRVVSVDCSRRLALRADEVPAFETRTVEDALVLPSELSPEQADEKAREAVHKWARRTAILSEVPDVSFDAVADAYKLFWLAERPEGDVILDSVNGDERPLEG